MDYPSAKNYILRKLETELREKHISRLIEGKPESVNTSSIHMDVLGDFRRVSGLLTNHVYQEFSRSDQYNILPRSTYDEA